MFPSRNWKHERQSGVQRDVRLTYATARVKMYQNVAGRKGPHIRDSQTSNRLFPFVLVICCSPLFVSLPVPPLVLSFAWQRMALSCISSSVTLPNLKTLMSRVSLSQGVNLNPTQMEQIAKSKQKKTIVNKQAFDDSAYAFVDSDPCIKGSWKFTKW